MNHHNVYLNFKHEPAAGSTPRKQSSSVFRYGPLLLATFAAVHIFPVIGASAAEPDSGVSRAVSFSDLDLDRQSDRRVLKSRVSDAARTVCQRLHDDLMRRDWCVDAATRQAAPQMRQAIAKAGQRQVFAANAN